ncbi:MAG: glycosyltransferase, partial [Bacteroidetes bacterium]
DGESVTEMLREIGPYFLTVSGDAASKNFSFLCDAYLALPIDIIKRFKLVAVGSFSSNSIASAKNKFLKAGLLESLVIFQGIDDKKLIQLYKNCELFIFPSLFEGFGIPLVEAMTYGCLILSSNTSVMPEICGTAAKYFNPKVVEELTYCIRYVINNPEEHKSMRENIPAQLSRYTSERKLVCFNNWLTEVLQTNNDNRF